MPALLPILRRASAIVAIALIFACSAGAQTATTVDKSEVEIVANTAALPSCTAGRNKETRWTDDEDRLYRCDGLGTWEVPSEFSEVDAVANAAALPACDASLAGRTRWTLDDSAIHRCDGVSTWETAEGSGAAIIRVADFASLPVLTADDDGQPGSTEDENRTFAWDFGTLAWIETYTGAFTTNSILIGLAVGIDESTTLSIDDSSEVFSVDAALLFPGIGQDPGGNINALYVDSGLNVELTARGNFEVKVANRARTYTFAPNDTTFPARLTVQGVGGVGAGDAIAIKGLETVGTGGGDALGAFFSSTGEAGGGGVNVGVYAEATLGTASVEARAAWFGDGKVLVADPISSEFVIEAGSAPTGNLLAVKDGGSTFFSVVADGSVVENGCTKFATSETPPSGSLCDEYFDTTQGPCFHNGTNFVEVGDKTTVCVV